MLSALWPMFGLRLTTPRLELRLPDEDDLTRLAGLAAAGMHQPGTAPFLVRWPYLPPAERALAFLQGQWRDRGSWSATKWSLDLAVFAGGEPVGMQELAAEDFGALREVSSFSWLGVRHHGHGYGTEMRAAMLHLAFAGLGAAEATSGAFEENAPSLAISARLGYEPDGISRDVAGDQVRTTHRLRLTRERWERLRQIPVAISGLEPCLSLFGAGPADSRAVQGCHDDSGLSNRP